MGCGDGVFIAERYRMDATDSDIDLYVLPSRVYADPEGKHRFNELSRAVVVVGCTERTKEAR